MKEAVRAVHPWIDLFIDRTFDRAANELCDEIKNFNPIGMVRQHHDDRVTIDQAKLQELKTRLIKFVDQMRAQS